MFNLYCDKSKLGVTNLSMIYVAAIIVPLVIASHHCVKNHTLLKSGTIFHFMITFPFGFSNCVCSFVLNQVAAGQPKEADCK